MRVPSTTKVLSVVMPMVLDKGRAKIFLQEKFDDEGWRDRWVVPTKWKQADEMGEWGWTAGEWYGGSEDDKGIKTTEDSRFYGLSAKLLEPFTQEKDLVLQFSVKNEQKLDCGGAYVKLMSDLDQESFGDSSMYQVMFGPDKCGTTSRTHVIFNYPTKEDSPNVLINKDVKMEKDQLSHVYTLHVKADGSFEVLIDQKSVRAGLLEDEFDFLPPREIKDPEKSKPEDWVDEKKIPDPEDKKPDGFDDIPKDIPDPDASKPDDWDDEEDGEWEPTIIRNPEYKGKWKPKMMDNADYKGPWEHPMIPNPEYKSDDSLFQRCKGCTHIGLELWQVKSGTIFDEVIVTDSIEEANRFAEGTWAVKTKKEKAAFDANKARRKDEAKAIREAEKVNNDDDDGEVQLIHPAETKHDEL